MQSKRIESFDILNKPFIDLRPFGIIMNKGEFKGSGLDRITGKPHSGAIIPQWYKEKKYSDIENYIKTEFSEFVAFGSWLYRELPDMLSKFKNNNHRNKNQVILLIDYLEGANYCETNSARLQTTARIILNDSDGTDSFALFLYHIAYEEIAKGIFCLFVHRGYVSEDFVNIVFKQHHPKIALFEEIFRSFAFSGGICYLGRKKLGEIPLDDFIRMHIEKIKEHRKETMNFLYVDKGGKWKVPEVEILNIEQKEKKIKSKIHALNLIFELVKNRVDSIGLA